MWCLINGCIFYHDTKYKDKDIVCLVDSIEFLHLKIDGGDSVEEKLQNYLFSRLDKPKNETEQVSNVKWTWLMSLKV